MHRGVPDSSVTPSIPGPGFVAPRCRVRNGRGRDGRLRGIACDPFWGVCFNSLVPGQVVLADEDTTKLGWSAGVGVQHELDRGALFIEARYMRVETSQPTEIIPIQIGFRF